MRALPRSEPLRFRFSGPPHGHRLGWACVLCPSQARAAQATRCLARAHAPGGECFLSPPGPSHSVSWVRGVSADSGVWCVSSGEQISDCDPPGGCQPSRIPEDLGSNWEPARSLVEDAISGAEIAPHLSAPAVAHLPLCLQRGKGPVCSRLELLWYSLGPLLCEQARLCFITFCEKVLSLCLPPPTPSDYPTVWVATSR